MRAEFLQAMRILHVLNDVEAGNVEASWQPDHMCVSDKQVLCIAAAVNASARPVRSMQQAI